MKARSFGYAAGFTRSAATRALGWLPGPGHILFVVWLGLVAGCGTVTFKRGASPEAMATAERDCRNSSTDEAGYAECLRSRGWLVTGAAAARHDTAAGAQVITEPQSPGDASDVAANDETSRRVASALAHATAPSAMPASTPPEPTDATARIAVASWWKFGRGAADLDRAVDACVNKLGDVHRPDRGMTVVTAGLHACLRTAGWHPVGESAPH